MPLKENLRRTDTVFSIPLCNNGGDHGILFFRDIGALVADLTTEESSGVLRTDPCPACKHALQVEFHVQNPTEIGWKAISPIVDLVSPLPGRLLN